jgi:hypothetical protein
MADGVEGYKGCVVVVQGVQFDEIQEMVRSSGVSDKKGSRDE